VLRANNALTSADAWLVETAFASKAEGFAEAEFNEEPLHAPAGPIDGDAVEETTKALATIGPAISDIGLSSAALQAQPDETSPTFCFCCAGAAGDQMRSPSASAESAVRVNDAVAWHIDKSALALGEPRRYVIAHTWSSSHRSRASYADAGRRMPIT
jgi:hypothetical protein